MSFFRRLPLLLALAAPPLWAAEGESLDDLFDDLEEGLPAEPAPLVVTPDQGDRPMFLYFGNLETQGVLAGGYTDRSYQDVVTSLYYYLHLKGGIDVMPIPEARLIGSFSTYLPQNLDASIVSTIKDGNTQTDIPGSTETSVNTGSSLSLDELYLDYAILKSAMVRIGKYGVTWGNGRIFNPGNLVSDTSSAINLRAFVPVGPFTLTGMVVAQESYFANAEKPRAEELGYAANVEFHWGWLAGGVSAFHELKRGTTADLALRTGLFGVDVYAEALVHRRSLAEWTPSYLVGAYRDLDLGTRFVVAGEYWYEGVPGGTAQRHMGWAVTTGKLDSAVGLKINAKWMHSLSDGSGQVVAGITAEPLPKVTVALGMPWTYGEADASYVTGNSDPEKRLLSALLSVTVQLDFEKDR